MRRNRSLELSFLSRRCGYCTGCNRGEPCRDRVEHFEMGGVFFVDGIRYDPRTGDVHSRPMFEVHRVVWCGNPCRCDPGGGVTPSNPPTTAELDRWTAPELDYNLCEEFAYYPC